MDTPKLTAAAVTVTLAIGIGGGVVSAAAQTGPGTSLGTLSFSDLVVDRDLATILRGGILQGSEPIFDKCSCVDVRCNSKC